MERGIRHNQGKPQWSQIDFKALEPMVRVLEQGGEKVGRDNWKKGLLVRETIESLLRHTFALLAGEDNDQESKQPHIGHILSNAMFISYMLQNRPDMDNRREKEETVKEQEYCEDVATGCRMPVANPIKGKEPSNDQFNAPEAILKFALSNKRGLDCFPDNYADKKLTSDLDVVVGGQNLKINPGATVRDAYNAIKKTVESGLTEPKGGVLDESNFRQIAQDFADRWQSRIELTIRPEIFKYDVGDEMVVKHFGNRCKCVVQSIRPISDEYISVILGVVDRVESQQNANIGRTYSKDPQVNILHCLLSEGSFDPSDSRPIMDEILTEKISVSGAPYNHKTIHLPKGITMRDALFRLESYRRSA